MTASALETRDALANRPRLARRPLIAAGMVLGMGLGGFVDGIVAHQLFQVHNMLSARYPTRGVDAETLAVNLEVNMFWDGLFHAFTWVLTVVGLFLLWRAIRQSHVARSGNTLVGSMLLGWGLFNLVEGIINHHILHIHHVIEGPGHLPADLAFLVFGGALVGGGIAMIWADGGRDLEMKA